MGSEVDLTERRSRLSDSKRALLEKPYGVGGAARLAGYLSACMRRPARQAPADVRSYYRNEQIVRVVKGNKIPDNLRVEVQ